MFKSCGILYFSSILPQDCVFGTKPLNKTADELQSTVHY